MRKNFPFPNSNAYLSAEDYRIFTTSFTAIIRRYIDRSQSINFFYSESDFVSFATPLSLKSDLIRTFQSLISGEEVSAQIGLFFFFAFPARGRAPVVVVAKVPEASAGREMDQEWLQKVRAGIERDFLLLKQARVDSQTGLLNLGNLHALLESPRQDQSSQLVLLYLPPGNGSLQRRIRHLSGCALALRNFVQGGAVLHYLGQYLFALFLSGKVVDEKISVETLLVEYLKKEGCSRVHIGSSLISGSEEMPDQPKDCLKLLDEAYTALQRAMKRGPFSFCEYRRIAFPEKHPFAKLPDNTQRQMSRWWTGLQSFSLILFQGDNKKSLASELVAPLVSDCQTMSVGKDLYVLYTFPSSTLERWLSNILQKASDLKEGLSVSAGAISYPFGDFKKFESAVCCKKALLHARFLGASSFALFNQLTLNISGDLYYADGDINLAIKEYSRGIKIGGGEVNLYNALGVSLAMMNRLQQAARSFHQALCMAPGDFIALYNLGLTKQSLGEKQEAITFFLRAYARRDSEDATDQFIADLMLCLGTLHCEVGDYEAAISFFEEWLAQSSPRAKSAAPYYYLGLSYFRSGDSLAARRFLEKAIRYNSFDDKSLHLLGRIYNEENQDDDLALIFCRKSIELNPDNPEYYLSLAEVCLSKGDVSQSREALRKCLRRKETKAAARLLMARGCLHNGEHRRARRWFEKALNHDLPAKMRKQAEQGLALCGEQ